MDSSIHTLLVWPLELGIWILESTLCFCGPSPDPNPNVPSGSFFNTHSKRLFVMSTPVYMKKGSDLGEQKSIFRPVDPLPVHVPPPVMHFC